MSPASPQQPAAAPSHPEPDPVAGWGLVAPVILVALLGMALAGGAFQLQAADQQRNAESTAERAAEATAGYASESFADFEATLLTTVSLFNTVPNPPESLFARFTAPVIEKNPDVKAIQFSVWVPAQRRAAFERRLARAGHPEGIRDPTSAGLEPAAQRTAYVPIRYNSPATGNEASYGLDIAYRPQAKAAVLAARDSANPQIGGRISLAQGGEALTIYAPVYRGPPPVAPTERINRFRGIVGVVMLLDGIRGSGSDALVDLALLSPAGDADGDTVLWASPGAQGQTHQELVAWPVSKVVNAPGRQLRLVGRPAEALVASLGPWRPWAIAGTVALVTILLAALTWKWIDARRLRTLAEDLGRASGRLRFLAERDPLTSLPHREGLRKWYESVRSADPGAGVALLFVDLDAFKDINTVWGHPTGDAILTQTAGHLAEEFLGERSIAVRLGGDEFVVAAAFPDGDAAAHVERMGRRVQDVVHQPTSVAGREFLLTASIGAAVAPDDGDALETLLARADLAVRRAKHESRGRCRRYEPEMSQRAAARERIVAALRRNARHPEEHFRLVYQPQVDMRSGRVVGLEALIRWHDAAAGWGSPEEFIPLAEQYGLMPALGDWVLANAGAQYADWLSAGLDIGRASVNVTAHQLSAGGFTEHLDEILTCSPALRGHLEIEITESTAMGAVGLGLLHQVRDAGVGIAIDDFGTGFSSLARLTEVPSQRVKIDRRFISRMTASQEALEVVRAIVHMAEALQLGTVAEGVETPEQAAILVREGVDVAQGFLYSRPLTQQRAGAVLRDGLDGRTTVGPGSAESDPPTVPVT